MSMYSKYLVCYDISNSRKRTKFSDSLRDLGLVPMQNSVFYGDLKPAEVHSLRRTAEELLDKETDKCFWFPCRLDPEQIKKCLGYETWNYLEPDGHGSI